MYCSSLVTPIGRLVILADEDAVFSIHFSDDLLPGGPNDLTDRAIAEFSSYFAGDSSQFTFPMSQKGSEFQQNVWNTLRSIPPGKPITYAALSQRMKKPLAIRAIAAANGKNNLMIAVPCHRVIGSGGKLTGFSAGLWRKKWLLEHEAKMSSLGQGSLSF